MNEQAVARDERFIARCIALAKANRAAGELPFGSLISLEDAVIVEAASCVWATGDVTAHAEVTAMRAAQRTLARDEFSAYTLYSNFEPCAMCAFLLRELRFGRVVFALASPDMGGYTKWSILQDPGLNRYFGPPPEVTLGILADRARESFQRRHEGEPG